MSPAGELGRLFGEPDRLRHVLDRAEGFVRARLVLGRARVGRHVYVGRGGVLISGDGPIELGDRVILQGGIVRSELSCDRGGRLEIGDECILNYGVRLHAAQHVRLGARCRLGSMVYVSDERREGTAPVTIGDDVWIAHGAIIEPGVTIGSGSVVSAGSVVTTDVPPGTLAVGNPARALPLQLARR